MENSDLFLSWRNSNSGGISDTDRQHKGIPKLLWEDGDDDDLYKGDKWHWKIQIKGKRPLCIKVYHDNDLIEQKYYNGKNTVFNFTIMNVTRDDAGFYEVKIENDKGQLNYERTLTVY